MRRLLRAIWNTTTVVSLLLLVAAAVLWIRGYYGPQVLARQTWSTRIALATSRGVFSVWVEKGGFYEWRAGHSPDSPAEWEFYGGVGPPLNHALYLSWFPDAHPPVAGFFFGRKVINELSAETMIFFPMPAVFAALALLPIAEVTLYRRRRRIGGVAAGHCPACGYDCRATPDRCPECGGAVPTAKAPRPGGAAPP